MTQSPYPFGVGDYNGLQVHEFLSQSHGLARKIIRCPPPPPLPHGGVPPPGMPCPPPLPPDVMIECKLPPPPPGCSSFSQGPTNSTLQSANSTMSPPPYFNYTSGEERSIPPIQVAISYAPKFMALLSVLCSSWIIYEILVKDRKKLRSIYHKVIALMSATDVLSSIWLFVGHWAVPKDLGIFVAGAAGTNATCQIQGFFLQLGLATPLYNLSLLAYSLLLVRYRWRETRLQRSIYAKWSLLCLPMIFGLGTAITALILPGYGYNVATNICGISPMIRPTTGAPERLLPFRRQRAIAISFVLAPLWLTLVLLTAGSVMIVQTVRKQELAASRWDFGSSRRTSSLSPSSFRRKSVRALRSLAFRTNPEDDTTTMTPTQDLQQQRKQKKRRVYSKSRKVVVQSIWFVGGFMITWLFYLVYSTKNTKRPIKNFGVEFMSSFLLPGQGFFNFLVFIRPRYVQFREQYPEFSVLQMIKLVLRATFCFPRQKQQHESQTVERDAGPSKWGLKTNGPTNNHHGGEGVATATKVGQSQNSAQVTARDGDVKESNPDETVAHNIEIGETAKTAYSSSHSVLEASNEDVEAVVDGDENGKSIQWRMPEPSSDESSSSSSSSVEDNKKIEMDTIEAQHKEAKAVDDQAVDPETGSAQHSDAIPDCALDDHERWLYADLPEEEFEIMFYSNEFSMEFSREFSREFTRPNRPS